MPKKLNKNIYSLTEKKDARSQSLLSSLPKPVRLLHLKSEGILLEFFEHYFSEIDTTFFELAKNAQNQIDQDEYFSAMRDMRSNSKNIKARTKSGIKASFVALAEIEVNNSKGVSAIKADNLSLVGNSEMDAIIAKESMVKRSINRHKSQLNELVLRLEAVVPATVTIDNLPIGPLVLCETFIAAIEDLSLEGNVLLVLLKLFEQNILENAGKLYSVCNNFLQERGILPLLESYSPTPTPTPTSTSDEKWLCEQEPVTLSSTTPPEPYPTEHSASGNTVNLQQCVGTRAPTEFSPENYNVPSAQSQHIESDSSEVNLFNNLKAIIRNKWNESPGAIQDINQLSKELVNSGFEGTATGRRQLNSIKLTHNLFRQFHNIFQHQPKIDSLIKQLELPVAQITCDDPSFLQSQSHSAKALLNQLLDVFIKLDNSGRAETHKDPLLRECESIIQQISMSDTLDTALFDRLLGDFEAFKKEDERRIALLERRTVSTEEGRLRSKEIEVLVNTTLNEVCSGLKIASAVTDFIEHAWRHVLFYTGLKYGGQSENWDRQLQHLIDLIAYSQPFSSSKDRREATQKFPELIQTLKFELIEISVDGFKSDQLIENLQICFENLVKEENAADANNHLAHKNVDDIMQSVDQLINEKPKENVNIAEAFIQQAKNLGRGSWFEMTIDDQIVRARLAAILGKQETFIFVNRSGLKIQELELQELALALQNQNIKPLNSNQMFDIALSAVISNTKSQKKAL